MQYVVRRVAFLTNYAQARQEIKNLSVIWEFIDFWVTMRDSSIHVPN